ncbi:hypothetical protein BHE74_00052928, partial [Ensete ventricosum]
KYVTVINFAQNRVSFGFRAPSHNFKILVIPNVLAHGKSYEHGFAKKRYGHKLCAKSSFDRFLTHRVRISKYWPLPTY